MYVQESQNIDSNPKKLQKKLEIFTDLIWSQSFLLIFGDKDFQF